MVNVDLQSTCHFFVLLLTSLIFPFQVYLFGGVQDVKDDDEELEGNFFNDLYTLSIENEKATWSEGEIRIFLLSDKIKCTVRFGCKFPCNP